MLFARKPAPVQVTHFGFPGTTGMGAMDWRVTDRHADPPAEGDPADEVGPYAPPDRRAGGYTTERLMGGADLAWCYAPPSEARAVGALPARGRGFVTFVCVNNPLKVTAEAVETWARILRGVPGARLEILADTGNANRRRKKPQDAMKPEGAEGTAAIRGEPAGGHLLGLFERHGIEA